MAYVFYIELSVPVLGKESLARLARSSTVNAGVRAQRKIEKMTKAAVFCSAASAVTLPLGAVRGLRWGVDCNSPTEWVSCRATVEGDTFPELDPPGVGLLRK